MIGQLKFNLDLGSSVSRITDPDCDDDATNVDLNIVGFQLLCRMKCMWAPLPLCRREQNPTICLVEAVCRKYSHCLCFHCDIRLGQGFNLVHTVLTVTFQQFPQETAAPMLSKPTVVVTTGQVATGFSGI